MVLLNNKKSVAPGERGGGGKIREKERGVIAFARRGVICWLDCSEASRRFPRGLGEHMPTIKVDIRVSPK